MIVNKKTGAIAYHSLLLTENGIKFVQKDFDGEELKRPLTKDEEFIPPQKHDRQNTF